MWLTLLMLITLIILLVLSQSLTVRVYGTNELRVNISLTLMALELKLGDKSEKNKHGGSDFPALLPELIKNLLPQTDVRVRSARFATANIYSNPGAMIGAAIVLPMLLAYVKKYAGTFHLQEESNEAIDIYFIFPFTSLIVSFITALYSELKKRRMRRKYNVG